MSCCSISSVTDQIGSFFQGNILDPIKDAGDAIGEKFQSAIDTTQNNIDGARDDIQNFAQDSIDTVRDAVDDAVDSGSDLLGRVTGALPGAGILRNVGIAAAVLIAIFAFRAFRR